MWHQVSIIQYPCKSQVYQKGTGIYLKAPKPIRMQTAISETQSWAFNWSKLSRTLSPPIHCRKWGLAAALLPAGLIGLCGIMELCAAVSIGVMMD